MYVIAAPFGFSPQSEGPLPFQSSYALLMQTKKERVNLSTYKYLYAEDAPWAITRDASANAAGSRTHSQLPVNTLLRGLQKP